MRRVYIADDNLISSLGFTTSDNMEQLIKGRSGIRVIHNDELSPATLPLSLVEPTALQERFQLLLDDYQRKYSPDEFTRLEKLLLLSIRNSLIHVPIPPQNERTLLVISTTKGNIDLLGADKRLLFEPDRIYLWKMAGIIRDFFGFHSSPLLISNACISGVLGILTAFRLIRSGLYDHAVVTGGDILSEFVISGFQSFQSLSSKPCKPYDLNRDGLTLGEAAGTMILTANPEYLTRPPVLVSGGSTTNDANHISGPSRTGEELSLAIRRTLEESNLHPADIGFINAHGTATVFNDEMESKAMALAGLTQIPLNSFKGYWGHTLGAAGIIESIAAIHAMLQNLLIQTEGFSSLGTSEPIHVIEKNQTAGIRSVLKTASGFGGCNAAILYQKG